MLLTQLCDDRLGFAIKDQDVGQVIGLDAAMLSLKLEGPSALFSGAVNGLQRRHAQILNEDLQLAVVPVAVGRKTEAALAAGEERDPGIKRGAKGADTLGDFCAKYLSQILI